MSYRFKNQFPKGNYGLVANCSKIGRARMYTVALSGYQGITVTRYSRKPWHVYINNATQTIGCGISAVLCRRRRLR